MWRNYPFSQRNKITKRAVGVDVGGDGDGGNGQNLKIENIGGRSS